MECLCPVYHTSRMHTPTHYAHIHIPTYTCTHHTMHTHIPHTTHIPFTPHTPPHYTHPILHHPHHTHPTHPITHPTTSHAGTVCVVPSTVALVVSHLSSHVGITSFPPLGVGGKDSSAHTHTLTCTCTLH